MTSDAGYKKVTRFIVCRAKSEMKYDMELRINIVTLSSAGFL